MILSLTNIKHSVNWPTFDFMYSAIAHPLSIQANVSAFKIILIIEIVISPDAKHRYQESPNNKFSTFAKHTCRLNVLRLDLDLTRKNDASCHSVLSIESDKFHKAFSTSEFTGFSGETSYGGL